MNNIGNKIQVFRKRANLTQKELGEKIGVSYQQISQYEQDKRKPKYETLNKIATALDVDTELFITQELPTQPKLIVPFFYRFTTLCAQNNLTPTSAIKKIGLSTGNLQNWECGRLPKAEIL